jgi:tripartite-type tricarboxylate transporter receptor subunit TctC
MPLTISRRSLLAAPFLATLAAGRSARAGGSNWRPSRTVRIVVPQTPGGTTDVMARFLSAHLEKQWGQAVVVENKPGAGGAIGTMDVVRSEPDGHTILIGNVGSQSIAYTLQRSLQYGPEDLIPVSNMIHGPNALIINKSIPVNTVPEFVSYLKDNNGKTNYGTPGYGQSPHLAGVWFNRLTNTSSKSVHYRGSGPASTDLMGGSVQFMFDALVNAIEPSKGGLVKMLAVTGRERYPSLPDVPTVGETMPELSNFVVTSWVGVFLPKNTPGDVVAALNAEIKTLLEQPEQQDRFLKMGGLPSYSSPEDYKTFIRGETEKWSEVISQAGLSLTAN